MSALTAAPSAPTLSWPRPGRRPPMAACLLVALALGLAAAAHAERADRNKPMVVEADRPGTVDLQRQVVVFNGNVVVTQGTMVLRAERIEMREMPDGYRAATALGSAGRPASWRQRRDGVDETVEGTAERIEFDGRAETLRFTGNSAVRRLRAGTVADEIVGGTILWDNTSEVFRVEGGSVTPTNPGGRVRVILSPRNDAAADASANPASAARGPRPATSAAGAAAPTLTPSRQLGSRP